MTKAFMQHSAEWKNMMSSMQEADSMRSCDMRAKSAFDLNTALDSNYSKTPPGCSIQ